MHFGVLAAVSPNRGPVGIVFFGARAGRLVPEFFLDHLRHVCKQTRRVGMSHADRGRGGEQDESVAIGLLRRIGGLLVVHGPEIAAVLTVSHPLPQERQPMVDDAVGARQPKQVRDSEAMRQSRCFVYVPVRAFVSGLRRKRPRVLIQREEAARRIEGRKLEEVEEGARSWSTSHSRWAASVVKRGVPAAGSSFNVDSVMMRKATCYIEEKKPA